MAQAVFYINGTQQYNAKVGDTEVFDIPGYPNAWLTQYQNGVLQYDGPEALPTNPLLLDANDIGVFQGTAFEIINGQKGAQIASWTFQITDKTQAPLPTTPATGTNPPGNTCATGLCTSSPPPSPPPPSTVVTIPVPTGGPPGSTPTTTPSGGGGLSPFGDLPGTVPVATTGTGGPGQGTSGAQPTPTTTTAFSASGFVKSPLFWLLLVLVALAYFMSE